MDDLRRIENDLHRKQFADRGYSDSMLFVGLTLRESIVDVVEDMRIRPEDYLGLNIRVVPVSLMHPQLRGMRIAHYKVADRVWRMRDSRLWSLIREIEHCMIVPEEQRSA